MASGMLNTTSGLAASLLLACVVSTASAQDASQWQNDAHSGVRLLAGSRSGPVILGGIAIQLQPGWKTYWRNPGDSGVSPQFDFTGSENVESVTVMWPAPLSFDDGAGGTALGYRKQVVLPLRIITKAADKPLLLRAHITYAVCDKICIPVEARAELPFTSVASTEDGALRAALDTVPKHAGIGDNGPFGVQSITREGKTVIVDVTAPDGGEVSLYVEGPNMEWALPVPKLRKHSAAGTKRFAFDLDGVPPGVVPAGQQLKLTLVGPERAFEINANVPPD